MTSDADVKDAVLWFLNMSADWSMDRTVYLAVYGAVDEAVNGAVGTTVSRGVYNALYEGVVGAELVRVETLNLLRTMG